MPGSELTVSRPGSLRDRVVQTIRDAVITGRFAPGSRLVERELCEMLGVSRTLVREALRQVEAEGWVNIRPFRGPAVATLTVQQVNELYQVRGALEGLAAQLCAERASDEQLAQMEAAVKALTAAQRQGDVEGQLAQAGLFYDLLRAAAGNALLTSQLDALSSRVTWVRSVSFSRPARARASAKEEIALMKALKARDGNRARALCEAHIANAAAHMQAAMAAAPPRDANEDCMTVTHSVRLLTGRKQA